MFERLLRAIYKPQNVYCVHVDQKSPENFTKAVGAIVSCLPNVFVASKLETVVYASWSRVQADLNCMKDLLATGVQWRYLLNTCGTDFPIKTNAEIVRSLRLLNGKNSLKSETTPEHKNTCWMYHGPERVNSQDQKSPENFTKAVRAIVSCLPTVFVASKLEKVVYASWSRVQADLNCMKDLLGGIF
ncbi:UNVERIFIED_CONTAM: hypothetical protein FKN15_016902 [Acipenser sinensis]